MREAWHTNGIDALDGMRWMARGTRAPIAQLGAAFYTRGGARRIIILNVPCAKCKRETFVVRKPALLVLIGVTLFGCLGGLLAAFVRTPHYQVDAIVVVYEMPHDLRQLVSPDEAQDVDNAYLAGALQPKVVQRVLPQFPGMTEAQLRASVQVSIIAYTMLTRLTVTANTPERAAAIANAVAFAWTNLSDTVNSQAWTSTVDSLKAHEQDILDQISATQQAITNAEAAGTDTTSLKSQLAVELQDLAKTDDNLSTLGRYRMDVLANAYVATPADPSLAVRAPDPIKLMGYGAAGGFALGFALMLWLIRRHRLMLQREDKRIPSEGQAPFAGMSAGMSAGMFTGASTGLSAGASTGEAYDAR